MKGDARRVPGFLAALLHRLGEEHGELGALSAPLAGRRLALEGLLPHGRRLVVTWGPDGPSVTTGGDDPADLTLSGPPGAFLDLLLRGASRRLTLSGRLDLAHDLSRYLNELIATRREALAVVLGDPLLGLFERGAERLGTFLVTSIRRGHGPANLLVTRDQWAELAEAAQGLRTRLETLVSHPLLRP